MSFAWPPRCPAARGRSRPGGGGTATRRRRSAIPTPARCTGPRGRDGRRRGGRPAPRRQPPATACPMPRLAPIWLAIMHDCCQEATHGRPFQMGKHPAPQGASGRRPVQAFLQVLQGDHRRCQDGRPGPRQEPAPASGDQGGQGAIRCPRTISTARSRSRQGGDARDLRGNPLRGLRPGRRGGDRRGDDRQPQPHRQQRALDLYQAWRQPRRDRLSVGFMFERKGAGQLSLPRRATPTP